eukprot:1175660-Prorocentrum_minimum.AAC.2
MPSGGRGMGGPPAFGQYPNPVIFPGAGRGCDISRVFQFRGPHSRCGTGVVKHSKSVSLHQ